MADVISPRGHVVSCVYVTIISGYIEIVDFIEPKIIASDYCEVRNEEGSGKTENQWHNKRWRI